MIGISIILCCYNSASRLPKTLSHLAKQQLPENFQWEIIVVNNNSTDNTELVAKNLWKSFKVSAPLKVVNEPMPGLSYARVKGMQVANYDLLLWCDDDNWLCDTYLQAAFEIMETNPDIGALGGWCEAAFEIKKPEWFDEQAKYFAVSKQGKRSGDITFKKGCLYGAGMVLRKSHWIELKNQGFKHLLNDRVGKKLSSGGDTEYSYALRLLGYKIWFDDRLYFKHYMTKERLHSSYVSRIRKAMAYSNFMLWPYLDLLQESPRKRKDLIKYAFKGGMVKLSKKIVALAIGNFEQREVAKHYFRNLRYCLFHYKVYKNNLKFLKNWIP